MLRNGKIKQHRVWLYTPHASQQSIHQSGARFRVAPCGRRFGKTLGCLNDALMHLLNKPGSVGWWVAPTYRQAEIAYDVLLHEFKPPLLEQNLKTRRRVTLGNGSVFEFKSGDIPDNLRGEGLDFLIMDECAIMARQVWEECLRPALADKRGRAIFIGTPKGRNWFYEIYQRAQEQTEKDWECFNFPSWKNYISFPGEEQDPEILNLKKLMPEDAFKQEIRAEFLPLSAGVFRNVRDCVFGPSLENKPPPIRIEAPLPDRSYVAGLDLARLTDFTVLIVMDRQERKVVFFDRFNQIDWAFQINRIVPVLRAYNNASLLVDKTGVGDAVIEELYKAGLNVQGIHFTASIKSELVQTLAVSIEQQEIHFPAIPELLNELYMFGYQVLPSGHVRYSAPQGHHDDCVVALALSNWKIRSGVTWQDFPQIESPLMQGHFIERGF